MKAPLRSEAFRVIELRAENVKRLKLVDITPKADVIEISGANGSGKSSVLDCILWALGGERTITTKPIRDGQEEARIKLDLGEIIVTRTFNRETDESHLTVETAKGALFDSPQTVLNGLLSSLAFDPLKFAEQMSAKEQLEALKRLVPLDIDLEAHDEEHQRLFDARTGIGRDVRALKARVDAYTIGPEWPRVEVDISGMLADMQRAGEHNQGIERRSAEDRLEAQAIATAKQHAAAIAEQIAALEQQLVDAKLRRQQLLAQIDDRERLLAERPEPPAAIDVTEIRSTIEAARATNEKVRLYREFEALAAQHETAEEEYENLTKRIEQNRAERVAAIARAKMPVDGLGFGAGEVTFNDLPLDQASSAQQLRVSLGIAMAMNPRLRVIRIQNGSLLDVHSMGIVRDMAAERGYQVWIERVDTSGTVGIYMEEGAVKAVDPEMAEALL